MSIYGSSPTTKKKRYVRQQKKYKDITSPQAVDVYNQHMDGVDLLDSMLGYYRIHLRYRQWYETTPPTIFLWNQYALIGLVIFPFGRKMPA